MGNQDPMLYVEEMADSLPNVSVKRPLPFKVNPQVSELAQMFDGAIESNLNMASQNRGGNDIEPLNSQQQRSSDLDLLGLDSAGSAECSPTTTEVPRKRLPPPLIPISVVRN